MDPGNRKAVLAAMLANGGIAVAKFVGFAITGASSMLAEGVHSVADTGNQGLLLWGGAAASRAPDGRHPFGYGRERYFWSFVVAQVLFVLGGAFAIYEGIHKLRHPEPISSPLVAVVILTIGIVLEGFSFRTAIVEGGKAKGSLSWVQFIKRSKSPELPVVLLEDLGALIGLALALVGVGLAWGTGDARFDAIGSLAIGLLLGLIAVLLSIEMKSLLIGEAANVGHQTLIREAIESDDHVRHLITMRTQHIGPEELLVGAKVEFDAGLSFLALTHAIDSVEERIRASVPIVTIIYVEPDIYEETPTGAA